MTTTRKSDSATINLTPARAAATLKTLRRKLTSWTCSSLS